MYHFILMWLVICTEALSHREPCKLQCDNNFKRNEISQPTYINICKRGCDLFTVALISTSHPSSSVSKTDTNMHPKVLPQTAATYQEHNEVVIVGQPLQGEKLSIPLTLNKNEAPRSHEMVKIEPPRNSISEILKKAIIGNDIPIYPSIRIEGTTMTTSMKASSHLENPSKVVVSQTSSKTTEEPISQPVQDHPVEAGKQTTTPKGPKREQSKLATPRKNITPINPTTMNAIHSNAIVNGKNILSKIDNSAIQVMQGEPFHDDTMDQRIEQAKHSCRHACVTAYKDPSEQEACVVGCHLQATTAALKPIDEEKMQPRSPIAVFQHVVFTLAHHVGRLVRVTWSLASSSPAVEQEGPSIGNKMQVYGSELMTRQAQVPIFVGLRQSFNEVIKSPEEGAVDANNGISLMNGGLFHIQRPMDPSNSGNGPLNMPEIITIIKEETKDVHSNLASNRDEKEKQFQEQLKKMENVLDVISDSNKRTKDDSIRIDHQDSQPQLDLLECISRKSGLPRWFIAIAIFASALVVLWLCFSLTAPPDDIKVVKRKPDISECLLEDDDDDFDDENLSCSEKKKLLARADDVIKIRIENV